MRPILEIVRLEEDKRCGTFGVLRLNKQFFCVTLEPSDELNAPNLSSIPAQQYVCRQYSSERYPFTFQVIDVPGRSLILFHPGNKLENTEGCILLGKSVYDLRYERGIANSGETFKRFIAELELFDV